METFKVAHLRLQGVSRPVDVMIVFVNYSVGRKTPAEQAAVANALQECSLSVGRAGNIVMVWQDPSGNYGFWARQDQHAFFKSVSYEHLLSKINGELTCSD